MRPFFWMLIVCPLAVMSQEEHHVSAGSEGNQIALAIENASDSVLCDVDVIIQTTPAWLNFNTRSVLIDSISSRAWQEAVFEFGVPDSVADRTESVIVEVLGSNGLTLGSREIRLHVDSPTQQAGLLQVYPNPANPSATIQFSLASPSHVKIEIYNMLGQRIRTLIEEDRLSGIFSAGWDGKNDGALPVASGMYFLRLHTTDKNTKQVRQLISKLLIQK